MSKEILEKVAKLAKNKGCDGFEISFSQGKSLSLKSQEIKIDEFKLSSSKIVGIRILKNQKAGYAVTEDMSDESLNYMVNKATENSAYSDIDADEVIEPTAKGFTGKKESLQEIPFQEKIKLAIELEEGMKKLDKRIANTPYNGYSEGESEKFFLNSNNIFAYESYAQYSAYTAALFKEGNESSMADDHCVGKKFSDLNLKKIFEKNLELGSALLSAKPIATGTYPVVFETEALSALLGVFMGVISGKKAKEKSNPWTDLLGKSVANVKLSFSDEPFYDQALFKSYVDDEGVLKASIPLVENGVFKSFIHNSSSAHFFGTKSTGHASRAPGSPTGISPSYLVVKAGASSEQDIYKDTVLEIHKMQGLHSGANFMSGDFSFGASGYLIQNGKRIQAVKGITVAANFYELIKQNILVGNKVEATSSFSFFSPKIRFEALSVAGL